MPQTSHSPTSPLKRHTLTLLHTLVLLASVALILVISWDTFHNLSFVADPFYLKIQYCICLFFLSDIVVEWLMSDHKIRYLWRNLLFVAVSIPYITVIRRLNLDIPDQVQYALRFMPMLRAAYVLAMVTGAFSANRMTSLFNAYMSLLLSTLYFGSLMFYIEERTVNPGVTSYWEALWWAIMDMTTCGSSINALTPTGQVLGVVLAAEGLILFPVFTVYITEAVTRTTSKPPVTDTSAHRSSRQASP